ncbi:MAG: carboxymuconolactone decarboxylase family protein [Myxococcota bacterium]
MARIPYADLETAHPKVREMYESLPVKINLFRMLAHAERNFRPLLELGGTILSRQDLDGKLREHAILYVAQLSGARYEWVQHVPIGLRAGASQRQIDALEQEDIRADCFDDEERDVLEFTRQVVRDVRPSDQLVAKLCDRLGNRKVIELTLAIGYYMMMARLMETTGVDLDRAAGAEIVERLEEAEEGQP